MAFFLLKMDPNYEHLSDLFFMLGNAPNGNVLGSSRAILSPTLRGCLRIYWIDEYSMTEQNINHVRELDGIVCFEKVEGVSVTINDAEWRYADAYIDRIFLPVIRRLMI